MATHNTATAMTVSIAMSRGRVVMGPVDRLAKAVFELRVVGALKESEDEV